MAENPRSTAETILADWRAGRNLPLTSAEYWQFEHSVGDFDQAKIIRCAIKTEGSLRDQLRAALPLTAENVLRHPEQGYGARWSDPSPLSSSFIANVYDANEIRAWWKSLDPSSMETFSKAKLFARTMSLLEEVATGSSKDWLVSEWRDLNDATREAVLDEIKDVLSPALCKTLGPAALERLERRERDRERQARINAISELAWRVGHDRRGIGQVTATIGLAGQVRASSFPVPDFRRTACELKVYDVNREVVAAPKASLGQFDPGTGFQKARTKTSPTTLRFNAWQLFHAAKKSELAGSFTAALAERKAWAMALDQFDLFEWDRPSLRLRAGGVFAAKDASRTYLAGRFAEGILHLLMMDKGYIYWDHIPSLCERAIKKIPVEHDERLRRVRVIKKRLAEARMKARRGRSIEAQASAALREPDFAFENSNGDVALAESKGGFAKLRTAPKVKTVLASALEQVAIWQSLIAPTPRKGYAVGTFWREVEDPIDTIVTVVDPPGERGDGEPLEVPGGDIRRGHYGAWLHAMGLEDSARALRDRREIRTLRRTLAVMRLNGLRFAVVTVGSACDGPLGFEFLTGGDVIGIEVGVLKTLAHAVHNPRDPLTEIRILEQVAFVGENNQETTGFEGSVFPDGSLLGRVQDGRAFEGFEEFDI